MSRSRKRFLSLMMVELAAASAETITRRVGMMAAGTASAAEYRRMVTEKLNAGQQSMSAVLRRGSPQAILAPWHRAATRNRQRLHKSRRR
jgi:hypothetical protein